MIDWTEQWDDCAPCEFCGSLVKQETLYASGWQPIETMPDLLWVYVFVPGAGFGFEARKLGPKGRIVSLRRRDQAGDPYTIHRATHWRPAWSAPDGSMSELYEHVNTA